MALRRKPKTVDLTKPVISVKEDDGKFAPVLALGGIQHDWQDGPFDSEDAARKAGLAAVEHLQ